MSSNPSSGDPQCCAAVDKGRHTNDRDSTVKNDTEGDESILQRAGLVFLDRVLADMAKETTDVEGTLEKNKKFKDFMNRIELRLEGSTEDDISSSIASFDKAEIVEYEDECTGMSFSDLIPCLVLN